MISTLIAVLSLAVSASPASERIVGASLFKNGYALVTHEIDTPSTGEYVIKSTPQGSLGTVWFTATAGVRLDSVVNTAVSTKVSASVGSLDAILRANVGRTLTFV